MPINGWIDEESVSLSHTQENYLAMRKKEIVTFLITSINLDSIMLSEIGDTGKDKYCYDITYGI